MEAEARFIRAVQYFYLASYYHDVPLVTKTLSLDEANSVKKSSRMEVLQYAADELKDVANILPRQKDLPKNELGRATAQAALVYLARTYLIMEDLNINTLKTDRQIKKLTVKQKYYDLKNRLLIKCSKYNIELKQTDIPEDKAKKTMQINVI